MPENDKAQYMRIRLICKDGRRIKAWLAIPLAEIVGTYSPKDEMIYFKKRMAVLKCMGDKFQVTEVIYLQVNKIPTGYTPVDPQMGDHDDAS